MLLQLTHTACAGVFPGRLLSACCLFLAGHLLAQNPYLMTDHGLGKYGYIEQDIPESFQYYRAISNAHSNIDQLVVRVWKGSDFLMYGTAPNTCGGTTNVIQQTYTYPLLAGVSAGTTIYPSVHARYCSGSTSHGSYNQPGYNERFQQVLDIAAVPGDNAALLYNTATGSQNVVLGFIIRRGALSGITLKRLWIQNTGTLQEGTHIPNAGFRLYYEDVTGSEAYDGTEASVQLWGDYNGNSTSNNVYGSDDLTGDEGIPIPAAGLHGYVVLTNVTANACASLTAAVQLMEDGLSFRPRTDFNFDLMRMEATPVTATAIPLTLEVTASGSGAVCSGGALVLNGTAVGGKTPYTYHWSSPSGFTASTLAATNPAASASESYTLRVTDGNGCADSVVIPVTAIPLTSLAVPTVPGTYFATDALDDASFTHYCDCANGLILLSVARGSWSPGSMVSGGTPSAGEYAVRVDVQPYAGGTRYVDLTGSAGYRAQVISGQWVAINRTWDLLLGSNAQEPAAPVPVRTYFTNDDYADVNAVLAMGAGPVSSINWLNFYKLEGVTPPSGSTYATAAAALADGHSGVMLNNIRVYHNTPGHPFPWTYAAFGPYHSATMSVPSFSGGGGGGGGNGSIILSVEWIDFQVVRSGGAFVLSGRVAAPEGITGYTVERSTDGQTFAPYLSLASASPEFTLTDSAPARGRNVYRVLATDTDGQAVASPAVEGWFSGLPAACSLFPNPATERLVIRCTGDYPAERIEVYDMTGRRIWQAPLSGLEEELVPVATLPPGAYTWRVVAGPDTWQGGLLKE